MISFAELNMKLALFAFMFLLFLPCIIVGMVVGLVYTFLKVGFNLIDYKFMEWLLNE